MNKASGGDGIPAVLNYDAVKVLHSLGQQIWNTQSWPQCFHRTGKGQFSFQSQRKAMQMNVQTTVQLLLFHMLTR